MAGKSWTLTDVERDLFVDEIRLTPREAGGAARDYSVTKRTLRGGLRNGVDVIEVDNGALRFVVIPSRGMGLWRARLASLTLGWKSPVLGPVNPALVRLDEASGIGWLDGFDELLVRCGLESNGAPEFNPNGTVRHSLHGKIANIPAHKVQVAIDGDAGRISVSGVVDEARLFGNKLRLTSVFTTGVNSRSLTITDTVTNLSGEPGELELLYHTNFGVPLLGPGARLVVPARKVVPRDPVAVGNVAEWDLYGPETPAAAEAVFFMELHAAPDGRSAALVRSADGGQGVSVQFNTNQLPCFTLWKNRQATADGYVTGLEPGVNFPNRKSFEKEKGRVVVLPPGGSRTFEVSIAAHPDAASVAAAEQEIAGFQQGRKPLVAGQPERDWSPFAV
jgi:galactose mutarotase-like enzyme